MVVVAHVRSYLATDQRLHATSSAGIARDHVTGSHAEGPVSGGFSRYFGDSMLTSLRIIL
jgi:hypothetical protein